MRIMLPNRAQPLNSELGGEETGLPNKMSQLRVCQVSIAALPMDRIKAIQSAATRVAARPIWIERLDRPNTGELRRGSCRAHFGWIGIIKVIFVSPPTYRRQRSIVPTPQ